MDFSGVKNEIKNTIKNTIKNEIKNKVRFDPKKLAGNGFHSLIICWNQENDFEPPLRNNL